MEQWVRDNLSEFLTFPVDDSLVKSLLQIENEQDVDDFLNLYLDLKVPKQARFRTELKKRRFSNNSSVAAGSNKPSDASTKNVQKPNDKKKGKSKDKENIVAQEVSKPVERKKTKYVNLYSQEGRDRVVLLKGRHKCDCEAKTHDLVNNCVNCGRIVCAQEGAGPCFFCEELVCTPQQRDLLSNNNKQADSLYNKLMSQKPCKVSEDALKHRDKLLEFDKNSAQRTKVIDDESDYYQTSNSGWLSKSDREKLQKREEELRNKKYESRATRKIVVDFAGREITEEIQEFDYELDEQLRQSAKSMLADVQDDALVCPSVELERPQYVELNLYAMNKNPGSWKADNKSRHSRIQDKEYLEMVDEGLCLSMHQPYASLLVAGIKLHEGRTWYSAHRGRLWIAAASKVPTTEEISTLKNRYKALTNDELKFPRNYPTSCLLGCVTVSDVLPQEEYRTAYPDGDSESPFVFICQDCYELPTKFPVKGKHKIYKLDKVVHQAATKILERSLKALAS